MFDANNINTLIKKAQKIQEKMKKIQKEIEIMEVTGESGAGIVKITINGIYNCKNIEIDESFLKENKKMIEDLITAAFNDASRRIREAKKQKMSDISKDIPFPYGIMNSII
ncbi:Nucleoid-associated protein YbaB [Buchnera aphidicola (Phyllaphis fagi)]|uniref:YbaB/EbfC family nucleoid-associated protein n=1 Tax=Buchnera aphidicola TaxID=9 RepID=UPI003463F488